MNKTKKILGAGLSALLMASVFASPTSDTTNGIFKADADKYMDVLDFSEVEFENMFGHINIRDTYTGHNWNTNQDETYFFGVDGGTAFRLGGLYIGSSYFGNLFSGSTTKNTEVKTVQTEGTGVNAGTVGSVDKTITETTTSNIKNNDYSYWGNRDVISVLFGIGNLGLKTTFETLGDTSSSSTKPSFLETNNINAPTIVEESKSSKADIGYNTTVEAGLPLSIGDVDFNLKTGLGFDVNRNTSKEVMYMYNWYNNEKEKTPGAEGKIISKQGSYGIRPSLYLSAFDAGLYYEGNFKIFANGLKTPTKAKLKAKTYSMDKNNNYWIASEKVINEDGSVETGSLYGAKYKTVKSETLNKVSLSYGKTKELNEKFTVGFKANTEVVFETLKTGDDNYYRYSCHEYDYSNAVSSVKDTAVVKKYEQEEISVNDKVITENIIGVKPTLSVAAQYKVIPSKVTLNFSANAYPASTYDGTHNWNYGNSLFVFYSKKETGNPTNVTTETMKVTTTDGNTVESKTVYDGTTRSTTEKLSKTDTFYNLGTSVSCGATFHMTENLDFDCTLNAVSKSGISDLLGLFNMNMAATFRF